MPEFINTTREELINNGYKKIEATFEGENIDKWYINKEGKVFSFYKNKGRYLKCISSDNCPRYEFCYKNTSTKRKTEHLLNTYFNNCINDCINDYKILTHINNNELTNYLKIYKNGDIYHLTTPKKGINDKLIIKVNPIENKVNRKPDIDGYIPIHFNLKNHKMIGTSIHRLIYYTFNNTNDINYNDFFGDLQINHKDHNPLNNCLDNLELISREANNLDKKFYKDNPDYCIRSVENNKYKVMIQINHKYFQKTYNTKEEAREMRDKIHRLRCDNLNITKDEIIDKLGINYRKYNMIKKEIKDNSPNIENIEKKTHPDYPYYMFYSNGKVWSNYNKCWLNGCINKGYKYIYLSNYTTNKRDTLRLNRIIAIIFIPNPENKSDVDHINRNKLDNSVSNLRWATSKENCNNRSNNKIRKL